MRSISWHFGVVSTSCLWFEAFHKLAQYRKVCSQNCKVLYNTLCSTRTVINWLLKELQSSLSSFSAFLRECVFFLRIYAAFWSCQSEKGRFCRVTTCQNEHLQSRMGGPVAFECTSVPEFDIGPITAPDNAAVCCCRLYWTEDVPLTLDPPHETEAVWTAHGWGFR